MCSICFLNVQNFQQAANYAFHALSESMNFGQNYLGKAFSHLLQIGKISKNPNIIIFATGFSEETLQLPERIESINQLK